MKTHTVRCWRFLAMMAVAAAFTAFSVTLIADKTMQGNPSYLRLLGTGAILLAMTAATVAMLANLRGRVIVSEAGLTVVGPFRRRHFAWPEITEITLDSGFRVWQVYVRSAEAEARAFFYPVTPFAAPTDEERYPSPPPHTPRGLLKLYSHIDLRDAARPS